MFKNKAMEKENQELKNKIAERDAGVRAVAMALSKAYYKNDNQTISEFEFKTQILEAISNLYELVQS